MIKENVDLQAEILRALGHPVRLAIAKGLLRQECNVNKMVAALGIAQSSVSQHLKVLKAAAIIKGTRKGVKVCYRIDNEIARRILTNL